MLIPEIRTISQYFKLIPPVKSLLLLCFEIFLKQTYLYFRLKCSRSKVKIYFLVEMKIKYSSIFIATFTLWISLHCWHSAINGIIETGGWKESSLNRFLPLGNEEQNISAGGGMNALENMKKSVLAQQRGVYFGGIQFGGRGKPELKFIIYESREVAADLRQTVSRNRQHSAFPYEDLLPMVCRGIQIRLFFENGEEMKLDEINTELKDYLEEHENNVNVGDLVYDIVPMRVEDLQTLSEESRSNI